MKLLLYLVIFGLLGNCGYACSCSPKPAVEEAFEQCDALIFGKIIQLTLEPSGVVAVVVEVEEQLKGKKEDIHLIHTWVDTGGCGYPFRIGKKYLIYCYGSDGTFDTGICSRTKEFWLWKEPSEEYKKEMKLNGVQIKQPTEEQLFIHTLLAKQTDSNQSH